MNERNNIKSRSVVSSGEPMKTDEQRTIERMARRRALALEKKKKRLKIFLKVGITLVTTVVMIGGAASILIKNPVEKGNILLNEGQYMEAVTEYNAGLEKIEYMAESYLGMGLAYYKMEDYDGASKCFESAIQKGENSSGVIYNLLSISYMNMEEYEKALDSITLAVKQEGNSEELQQQLRYNEVVCMEMTADWEGAKAKATSYLQSYPDDENMTREMKFLETR